MDEIVYIAKAFCKEKGKWVQGFYIHTEFSHPCIIDMRNRTYKVDPKTLSFTKATRKVILEEISDS